MAGQVWVTNTLGGYMGSPLLSNKLRMAVQPLTRFRQFCDIKEALGMHKGDLFHWNVYSDVKTEGTKLTEENPMPETNFDIDRGTLTIAEFGNSVPYTGKLDDLSVHPVTEIINRVLKNDCRKNFDRSSYAEFNNTVLQVVGGASGAVTLTDNGVPSGANSQELTKEHVKSIADLMEERNIPTYDGENYMCVARPTTLRPLKNDLEQLRMYTPEGYTQIMNGEKGRYEGIRFIQQTNIESEGWASGKSDAAFFFGSDTVAEAITIAEEIRGKLATDYGRSKGVAYYALLGYGLCHKGRDASGNADSTLAKQARIIKWASAESGGLSVEPETRTAKEPETRTAKK